MARWHVAGYTLHDHRRNTDIRPELNIMGILDMIAQYRLNWWEHLCRVDDCRIPKQIWNYKPRGRRGVGRPRSVSYTHLDVYKRQNQGWFVPVSNRQRL